MIMQKKISYLVFILLCVLCSNSWSITNIESARVWRAPDHTRLVLDLSGPVTHSIFTLNNPFRVVIDIDQTTMEPSTIKAIDLAETPILSIRQATRNKHHLRVVLDLSKTVMPRSFVLKPNQKYNDRLVIDLFDSQPKATTKQVKPKTITSAKKRNIIIAIDAGHGGEDPGAIGVKGLKEKHVVLSIAKKLNSLFKKERGFQPVLVRNGDYYIGLRKRTKIARSNNADLFVSIHADAFKRRSANGASVFALSQRGATSETGRWLARKENSADLIGGVGSVSLDDKDDMLAEVLLDLSMTATLTASLDIGSKVLKSLGKTSSLHKNHVEQAGFAVLKSPDIPSILVETGFISNPYESKKLASKSHQGKLANAIFAGVKSYFQKHPPPGSYFVKDIYTTDPQKANTIAKE